MKYVVLYSTYRPSSVLNARDLEYRSGCDEHGQPFPLLRANQRKGHGAIGLWTRYAFRSFGGIHRAVYWCQFRDASFNKYTQGRWCVGGGGKPHSAELSARLLMWNCTGLAKDQADVLSALSIPGQPAPTVLFLLVLHPLSSKVPNYINQDEFAHGVFDCKHSQSCAQELAVPAGVET